MITLRKTHKKSMPKAIDERQTLDRGNSAMKPNITASDPRIKLIQLYSWNSCVQDTFYFDKVTRKDKCLREKRELN